MTKYTISYTDGVNGGNFTLDKDDVMQLLKSIVEILEQVNCKVVTSMNIAQLSEYDCSEKKRSKI